MDSILTGLLRVAKHDESIYYYSRNCVRCNLLFRQGCCMKPEKKYLIVMDLDDADHDLREAEREYNEIEKERETLVKWDGPREIPSELWGEINSRRKKVLLLKEEVKRIEKKLKNFDKEIKTDLKMPDELEELKLRLRIEVDDRNPDVERVIDEWYEEYQDTYKQPIDTSIEKDVEHWRNWALQNVS